MHNMCIYLHVSLYVDLPLCAYIYISMYMNVCICILFLNHGEN